MNDEKKSKNSFFVDMLLKLDSEDKKGALAEIRRASSNPDEDFLMLRVIGSYLPKNLEAYELNDYKRLACLFATHKMHTEKENFNFGDTCRLIHQILDAGKDSFESRFAALLNAHSEDLYHLLLPVVRYAKDKDVSINYDTLFNDMRGWGRPDKYVQKKWAKTFWTFQKEEDSQDENN